MKDFILKLLGILLYLILVACASRSVPTGGPKDEDPPQLMESFPKNKEINYSGNEINLSFNEKVKVQNLEKELMITPNLDIEFEHKTRKNTVILSFEDKLPDSTTITLNFREAIQDITEGNAAENLQLVFSTGSYIDSLSLSGNIYQLLVNKPVQDVNVALYHVNDTLDIFNGKPVYLTKSIPGGKFTFENLKSDVYQIYAFLDKNKNGICESQKEPFGFLKTPVNLDSNLNNIQVPIQVIDSRKPELITARQTGHYFTLKYNKYLIESKLQIASGDSLTYTINEDHTSMKIFNTFPIQDSLQTFVHIKDSIGHNQTDTIYIKFEETRREKDPFNITISDAQYFLPEKSFKGSVTFSKPVSEIIVDSINIQYDSAGFFHFNKNRHFSLDPKKMELSISVEDDSVLHATFIEDKPMGQRFRPTLFFNETSIISIERDSAKESSKSIRLMDPANFGIIKGRINTDFSNFIIQLLDSKNKVVQSIANVSAFRFDYVEPGKYRIRLLIDANNNGDWNPGNVHLNSEPEPVYFYTDTETGTEEIQIKSNWEISELVLFTNDTLSN